MIHLHEQLLPPTEVDGSWRKLLNHAPFFYERDDYEDLVHPTTGPVPG
jgi:hypothetical protein